MHVVVYGAGAVGGVVGARLTMAGTSVTLVARGAHADAIGDRGLLLQWPEGEECLRLPVATTAADVQWTGDDVVVLAVKSQDTEGVLSDIVAQVPDVPIVCCQNGVANERRALRLFEHVYGICVMCPTSHLAPGVVQAHSWPLTGCLDLGRYPRGTDGTADRLARALSAATFDSEVQTDVMRWKYRKLLMNLSNSAVALFLSGPERNEVMRRAVDEGRSCLAAAGISVTSDQELQERRAGRITPLPVAGAPFAGGSTWQSLARGTGTIETDFLNGEIVLLGRLHGVDTPVNRRLQELARDAARRGARPGQAAAAEALARSG